MSFFQQQTAKNFSFQI
ncbi:hypothetical protein CAEBREN_24463 [Caenorhabditis brenneri]|uniref:Uncharacterized protein n=1 Tax=Caenorhabditis brenneri TaxID=135651 RepID=G0P3H1_CAEBE|nr:hypothetical protein CAEBREN_24463 [Caenorhabditis brenneri]